jgi:hypothetical protein
MARIKGQTPKHCEIAQIDAKQRAAKLWAYAGLSLGKIAVQYSTDCGLTAQNHQQCLLQAPLAVITKPNITGGRHAHSDYQ